MFTPPTPLPHPPKQHSVLRGGSSPIGQLGEKKKIASRIKVFVTAASQLRLSQPPKSAGIIPAEGGAARATLVR